MKNYRLTLLALADHCAIKSLVQGALAGRSLRSALGSLAIAATCHAQTAGIDFDFGGPTTESGFLSVPATGAKDYNVTHNGITFDIDAKSTLGNQNRLRGSGADVNNDLTTDFIQWYSREEDPIPEAAITLSGLLPTSEYQLSFYHFNNGAFQQPHSAYNGTVATGIPLGTATVSSSVPNVDYIVASDSDGEMLITLTGNNGRLTFNGMSVTYLGPAIEPQPLEITELIYNEETDEISVSWKSNPDETYGLYWSENLKDFQANISPTIPAAAEGIVTTFGPFPSPVPNAPTLFFRVGPPDFQDPAVSNVVGNNSTITINFSEVMAAASATDPSNFIVTPEGGSPITIASAVLNTDGTIVTLTTASPLGLGNSYTVGFQNLTDLAGRALPAITMGDFATWDNNPNGVKVFILAGQSNTQGHGWHDDRTPTNGIDEDGTIRKMIENDPNGTYDDLLDASNDWITLDDVQIFTVDGNRSGGLTVGYGVDSTKTGPEFGFGWQVTNTFAEDVLIIKTCWGGKSLKTDFRPPSAVQERGGEVGFYYEQMFTELSDVLANIGDYVPGYTGQGYEFKGFGWHQGWNDRVDQSAVNEYEDNLVDFINDVRSELGIAELPFVVANTGIGGPSEANTRALALMQAQLNVGDDTLYPEFADNVASIDTRPFWRDASVSPITSGNQGFHWNQNGETLFLIGEAMGEEMMNLVSQP